MAHGTWYMDMVHTTVTAKKNATFLNRVGIFCVCAVCIRGACVCLFAVREIRIREKIKK